MMQQKATNITWHDSAVTQADREQQLGQQGVVLWFTGLSGSGKSTVSVALEQALHERGHLAYRLDGDNIRHGLNQDLGFSDADRTENIRRIGEVAKLFTDAGLIVMTAFISPFRADRDAVRALLPEGRFLEVYVRCDLDTCEQRDPKGLYKKARAGEIKDFTGIDSPYEEPLDPEIVVDTGELAVDAAVAAILEELKTRGILNAPTAQKTDA
jgi:adenylylsulfate kinase